MQNNTTNYSLIEISKAIYHLITSKIFRHPAKLDSLLVCSGDEDLKGAYIWERNVEKPLQKFELKSAVLDVGFYKLHQSNEPILALLT